jgi:diguanylate cyclase
MYRVIGCLTDQHDLLLVAAAIVVCALASLAAFVLLERVEAAQGRRRWIWFSLAATAVGGGTWATHFVAMLGYNPGLPATYDFVLTLASVGIAIAASAVGLGMSLARPTAAGRAAGGVVVGLGVGAMHYLGMGALLVPGQVLFDAPLVATSVVLGAALAAAAFATAPRGQRAHLLDRSVILATAIIVLHFTGMGAVTVLPDGALAHHTGAVLDRRWLAALVAMVAVAALFGTLVAIWIDARFAIALRATEAARHLRGLADATFEGIAICDGPRITEANQQLAELLGRPRDEVIGTAIADILRPADGSDLAALLADVRSRPAAAALAGPDGPLPVEVRTRLLVTSEGSRIVVALSDIRERCAAEARERFLATHDALTGLPNRRRLQDEVARALARTRRGSDGAALLLVDLDRFKQINDLHGHPAGDRLLKEVAGRLRAVTREADTLARLGGDEFALVVDLDADGLEDASRLAHRIVATLKLPIDLGGITVQIGCSVGIALAPRDANDPEGLMRLADLALYRAKAEGRNCFRFFEASMDIRIRERTELETELRLAIARDELVPYFQPLVALATGRLIGFEMLARWTHPIRGMVPPDKFVPIAEDTGLVAAMTEQLLRKACRVAAAWPRHLSVAVNISSLQLHDHALPAVIRSALEEAGLPAHRLELELTESALLGSLETAREIVGGLKSLGVRFALDDFGTGYSSLAHLQALPFDKIKIDASFVCAAANAADSRKIVAAVVGLGLSLGLLTVAEGIETSEQAGALARLGCDIGQGWLFGRPIPAEAVDALLAGWEDVPPGVADIVV